MIVVWVRWTWITLSGPNNSFITIISAYRPCESRGESTVYQQHFRGLMKKDDARSPRKAFDEDLVLAISTLQQRHEEVILMLDANESIKNGALAAKLRELLLREVILERNLGRQPPATHQRNERQIPIDGIWATSGLHPVQGGYRAFRDAAPSDHRALWVDFDHSSLFGRPSNPSQPCKRRLSARNPRLVIKYNKELLQEAESQNWITTLQGIITEARQLGWNSNLEQEYNRIHTASQRRCGQVPCHGHQGCRSIEIGLSFGPL